jgi:hypothetical protein
MLASGTSWSCQSALARRGRPSQACGPSAFLSDLPIKKGRYHDAYLNDEDDEANGWHDDDETGRQQ